MTIEDFIHSAVYEAAVQYYNTLVTAGTQRHLELPMWCLLASMQATWDVP